MSAVVREQRLGRLRWLVVSGKGGDCFRALGAHMRAEISQAVTASASVRVLRGHVSASPGARCSCPATPS